MHPTRLSREGSLGFDLSVSEARLDGTITFYDNDDVFIIYAFLQQVFCGFNGA